MSKGFDLSDKERQAVDTWWSKHKCRNKYSGAIGGAVTYEFTPTGIGVCVAARCNHCRKRIDVTDFSCW